MISLVGCQSALRKTMYSAYETVGIEKRDLLKKRIITARNEEEKTNAEFKDALTRLRSVVSFDGGPLEKEYDSLKSSYDRSLAQSQDVKKSVTAVETVANDLFVEWQGEIEQISSSELKNESRKKLRDTESKYRSLHSALKKAEAQMEPVLRKFNDQVLFLKHNLNAQAIGSLKGEMTRIQSDITLLIRQMDEAIGQADRFIGELK